MAVVAAAAAAQKRAGRPASGSSFGRRLHAADRSRSSLEEFRPLRRSHLRRPKLSRTAASRRLPSLVRRKTRLCAGPARVGTAAPLRATLYEPRRLALFVSVARPSKAERRAECVGSQWHLVRVPTHRAPPVSRPPAAFASVSRPPSQSSSADFEAPRLLLLPPPDPLHRQPVRWPSAMRPAHRHPHHHY